MPNNVVRFTGYQLPIRQSSVDLDSSEVEGWKLVPGQYLRVEMNGSVSFVPWHCIAEVRASKGGALEASFSAADKPAVASKAEDRRGYNPATKIGKKLKGW